MKNWCSWYKKGCFAIRNMALTYRSIKIRCNNLAYDNQHLSLYPQFFSLTVTRSFNFICWLFSVCNRTSIFVFNRCQGLRKRCQNTGVELAGRAFWLDGLHLSTVWIAEMDTGFRVVRIYCGSALAVLRHYRHCSQPSPQQQCKGEWNLRYRFFRVHAREWVGETMVTVTKFRNI